MSNVETAIEGMIQTYIDENDFITRMDAEAYIDSEVNDARADMEGELTELQHRIEALEEKAEAAAEEQDENLLQELADSAPRAVNQIDWIMTHQGLIAGYDSKSMLESYVRSVLPADQTHQAEMIIAMTLATARNIINKKLEAES